MAKVLLGQHNIEQYIDREEKSIRVDGSIILPPGMKDYLQTEGISLLYAKPGETQEELEQDKVEAGRGKCAEHGEGLREEVIGQLTARIVSILKDKHQMTDEETIRRICLQVIKQINL